MDKKKNLYPTFSKEDAKKLKKMDKRQEKLEKRGNFPVKPTVYSRVQALLRRKVKAKKKEFKEKEVDE